MDSHAAGTTYCLAAGTFRVTSIIRTEVGDKIIGAGRSQTHIDGTGLASNAEGIFSTRDGNYFANFDIFGAPTPTARGIGPECMNSGRIDHTNCGKAFSIGGGTITFQSLDCHDNGGNCIGGGGSTNIIVDDLNCWDNGNAYSMTSAFTYAACIKRSAGYVQGNDTIVTNSYIHDNPWVGIWCDYCKYGLFRIEGTRFVNNGLAGIHWEMSGGWTSDDRAIIANNTFQGNNYLGHSYSGGMHVSTANDITITGNTFGANHIAGVNVIFTASRTPPQPDSRGVVVRDNTLNGDPIKGCSLAGATCSGNASPGVGES